MTDLTRFAADGEPCASCGLPLAADQRYCLACGHRRAAARLPFLDILRDDSSTQLVPFGQPIAPVGAAVPPPYGGSLGERAQANTGLIAGVGVLLLAMLIGVLVGTGLGQDDGSSAAAANQKPVVVSVGGGAAAPAAAPATTAAPTDTGASTTTPADTSKGASDSSSSDDSATTGKATIKPKAVSKSKIKSLDKLSGKEYQKQVDKLGKNIAVGGKAPPKDNKPAGGGTSSEDIG